MRIIQTERSTTSVFVSSRILNRENSLFTILSQRIEVVIQIVLQSISCPTTGCTIIHDIS